MRVDNTNRLVSNKVAQKHANALVPQIEKSYSGYDEKSKWQENDHLENHVMLSLPSPSSSSRHSLSPPRHLLNFHPGYKNKKMN